MNSQQSQISLEVLAQRQANTDHAVQQLQSQFSSSFGKLESQINTIAERMASAGRPNWPAIVGFIGTLVVIVSAGWGLGVRPLESRLIDLANANSKTTAGIEKISDALAVLPQTYLSRQEWDGNRLVTRQDNENRLKGIDADIAKLSDRLQSVDDSIVPRGEHEERWRSQEAAVENARKEADKSADSLQRQIDEVKQSLGGIYGARDVIRDLQARMDRLEVRSGGVQ